MFKALRATLGLVATFALLVFASPALSQVSLTTLGTAYTQNFDTLPTTGSATWTNDSTIAGWYHARTGTGTTIVANNGSSNAGNLYSYGTGTATDRSLGSVGSGNAAAGNFFWGVRLKNDTGATIESLDVSYVGEQWRNSAAAAQTAAFSYLVGSPSVTGSLADFQAAGTAVASLDFTSPITGGAAGALDGNAAANRTAISFTITGLSIPNGTEILLRWSDPDHSGSDHGLSIDDFSVTPNGAAATPNLSIDDVATNEGNAGTAIFTFTVSLSSPAGAGGVTFDIATADDTAVAPGDYTSKSLTGQTIAAGNSTYTFDVLVNGDTTIEPDETFFVNITNVTGANVTDAQGVGTIQADDAGPTLSIDNVSLAEGDMGTTTFTFTVSLSQPAGASGVSFDIATTDGTAAQPGDYTASSLTSQTITSGNSTYTFSVLVNGDTTVEPNETFFVNVTNITNAVTASAQGTGTIVNDDYTPIHDIQGSGSSSPLVSTTVTTQGIVTGVKSNGFFIQEEDALADADPMTSEGVFVFTSTAPPAAAAVGNRVQVTGTVVEFIPSSDPYSPPLTEISSPTTSLVSTGNPLPAAIPLSASFPDPAGSIEQLERLEGMRVSMASMTVGAATQGTVSEANATATSNGVFHGVFTGLPRAFREPGIRANDPAPTGSSIPPIPRWDANPEIIRVDSDGLTGAPIINVNAGAIVTNLVGPLDYGFRAYSILPDPGSSPGVSGGATATAVTDATSNELTVATYNMERFFDTVNDPSKSDAVLTPAAFDMRLNKASLAIRNYLKMPDIIGIVEMENLTTLQTLATRISNDAVAAMQTDPQYVAYLVEGNDIGGIDVGFLVKTAPVAGMTPRVSVTEVVQELAGTLFVNPDMSTDLLNDRPPLRLTGAVNHANGASFPITVIVNHLRSLGSVDSESAGSNGWSTSGARVRAKRQKQAEDLANLVQSRQTANAAERIVLVGDFNAFEFNDGFVDSMGVIAGTPSPDTATAVPGDGIDLVDPDFVNLFSTKPASERYSYVFDGSAQSLDHVLINARLVTDTLARRIEHARINSDFMAIARSDGNTPLRLSDHDPVVSYYSVAAFATAGLSLTKTDSPDPVDPGANLTYTITITNTGPNNADSVTLTDTLPSGVTFVSLTAPGGWSCSTPAVGSTGTVSCSISSLGVTSAGFTLVVKVDPGLVGGTVISNTATVSSTTVDPTPGDESATTTTTVNAVADLSVSIVDTPDPVAPGAGLTYTITAINAGPSSATSASMSNTLPAGTTFVSLSAPAGWSCTTPAVGMSGTVTCTNASFAAGNAVFTLATAVGSAVPGGTIFTSTASVTSSTTDPNAANNSASASTTVASPSMAIGDATVVEGNAGTTPATFIVTLSYPAGAPVSVSYATASGTATAGSDFVPAAGSLTFAPGETSKSVTVLVAGDLLEEANETFYVDLSGLTGPAVMVDSRGVGTIADDDTVYIPPDPKIVVTGCTAEGGACSMTVTSTTGMSQVGWIYTWFVDGAVAGVGPELAPRLAPGTYVVRVDVRHGGQIGSASTTITIVPACPAGRLCMRDGRFSATVVAKDPRTGKTAAGVPLKQNDQFGFFALPALTGSVDNPEVFLKVLDGRASNGNFWYFYNGLTDLELTIEVTDGETGTVKRFTRPGGSSAGGFDVGLGVTPEECAGEVDGTELDRVAPSACTGSDDALCLTASRFKVELFARDQRTGNTAHGVAIPKGDVFGYFALPGLTGDATNPEVFVKVLDGRSINGHFWVFFAGLTDLEYTVTVTDTVSGVVKSYGKAAGSACGAFDTNGF